MEHFFIIFKGDGHTEKRGGILLALVELITDQPVILAPSGDGSCYAISDALLDVQRDIVVAFYVDENVKFQLCHVGRLLTQYNDALCQE